MTAGGSPTEFNDIAPPLAEFNRNFGGVLLAVKNEGPGGVRVTTR
jgi:hypothetical protein